MVTTASKSVRELNIDLNNFRTVPQENEVAAIKAMIAISPDKFWALTDSLAEDGYLPTENIIVLQDSANNQIVKEGNRRVAALKLLLGLVDSNAVGVSPNFEVTRAKLPAQWISDNSKVPCNVYSPNDAKLVDRIVTRTHGKNAKAGRDDWESVARARHNRSVGAREPALDLLEKYLANGTNLSIDQRDRWAGKYPVSVLDEAIKRIARRCGYSSSSELAKGYPDSQYRKALDDIIFSIGMETLQFHTIRDDKHDFALRYGIEADAPTSRPVVSVSPTEDAPSPPISPASRTTSNRPPPGSTAASANPGSDEPASAQPIEAPTTDSGSNKTAAVSMDDERSLRRALKALKLHGPNRTKVESLRKEALKLKLKDNPIAFCFLLRSMFELSAKAYCEDHKSDGLTSFDRATKKDKMLAKLLGEIVKHMTDQGSNKEMDRLLHGAMVELGKVDGLLSITSLNQLVHNPNFVILPSEIPLIFGRVLPLLDNLNK